MPPTSWGSLDRLFNLSEFLNLSVVKIKWHNIGNCLTRHVHSYNVSFISPAVNSLQEWGLRRLIYSRSTKDILNNSWQHLTNYGSLVMLIHNKVHLPSMLFPGRERTWFPPQHVFPRSQGRWELSGRQLLKNYVQHKYGNFVTIVTLLEVEMRQPNI